MGQIKALAKEIKKDHPLAQELWQTGDYHRGMSQHLGGGSLIQVPRLKHSIPVSIPGQGLSQSGPQLFVQLVQEEIPVATSRIHTPRPEHSTPELIQDAVSMWTVGAIEAPTVFSAVIWN